MSFSKRPVLSLGTSTLSSISGASKKSGIIIGRDNWGMVGQDTSSYLVADTEDRLRSKARAAQWTKQIGQACGLWEQRRYGQEFIL